MKIHRNIFLVVLAIMTLVACGKSEAPVTNQPEQTAAQDSLDEVRAIAKEAYMYANPMVDNYRVMYAYFVDTENPEFKAPWNEIKNIARVYTSDDRMIQAANSDTPYSFVALDLRAEPLVLTVPPMEENRYFSIQLSDMYTHIFGYIGTRTAGNRGGSFMIAGPDWSGGIPMGITRVIKAETQLALAVYRTQLFSPDDLDNVKAIQAEYKVQTLSEFFGRSAPEPAPVINFIAPLTPEEIKQSLQVFNQLNWVLQFCPTHDSEQELMERFAKIDIGAGKAFDPGQFSPEMLAAMGEGIKDAWAEFMAIKAKSEIGELSSADIFGSRRQLQNNYSYRFAAAVFGIYGNAAEEAFYIIQIKDADDQALDSANRYTLRFGPDELPPVNAFWSMTMYELPDNMLTANPINRYLLNSTMLSEFKRDADGGLTFYIQSESPGQDKEANWLPSPASGQFSVYFRFYWPKREVINGTWQSPIIQRVK
jgi:hypothetical protein